MLNIWRLVLVVLIVCGLSGAAHAQVEEEDDLQTSLPIDWNETSWSRVEWASLDLGVQNIAIYAYLKWFGYHRSLPKYHRIGIGADLLEVYSGKVFHNGTGVVSQGPSAISGLLPVRVTFILYSRAHLNRVTDYEIISESGGILHKTYRYKELGHYRYTTISPLLMIGVSTSQWGTRSIGSSTYSDLEQNVHSDWEQDIKYWDAYLEGSLSFCTEDPPFSYGASAKMTVGLIFWSAEESAHLPAESGNQFYVRIGFGWADYKPIQ